MEHPTNRRYIQTIEVANYKVRLMPKHTTNLRIFETEIIRSRNASDTALIRNALLIESH